MDAAERDRMTSRAQVPARYRHLPGLDGVRGVAITGVVLYHFSATNRVFRGGWAGVTLFFALSGFLITWQLLAAPADQPVGQALRQFYMRRVRRLWPAVVAVLAIWSVLVACLGRAPWFNAAPLGTGVPLGASAIRWTWVAWLSLTTNWVYASGQRFAALGYLWSLAVEEQFYLLWPSVLLRFHHRKRLLRGLVVGAIALSALLPFWYRTSSPLSDPRVYFGTDTNAQSLLMGVLLALVFAERDPATLSARSRRALTLLGYAGLVGIGVVYLTLGDYVRWRLYGGLTMISVFSALVVAGVVAANLAERVLTHPVLVWLGRRSYALYLWHRLLAVWTQRLGLLGGLVGIAISLLLAELSWRLVEVRFQRRRARLPGVALPRLAPPSPQITARPD